MKAELGDAASGGDPDAEPVIHVEPDPDTEVDVEVASVPDSAADVGVESHPASAGDEDARRSAMGSLDESPGPIEALPGRRPGATSAGPEIDHRPTCGRDEVAAALATRMVAQGLPRLADGEPRDLDLRSDLDVRVDPDPPPVAPVAAGTSAAHTSVVRPSTRRRNQLVGFLGLLLVALLAWLVTRPAVEPDAGVARDVPPVTSAPAAPTTTEPGPALIAAESADVTVPADVSTTAIVLVNRGGRPGDFELLTEPEGAVLVGQRSGTLQPGERRTITVTADRFDGPATDWATTITLLGSGAEGPQAIRVAIRG